MSSTTRVQKHRRNETDEQIRDRRTKDREYKRRMRAEKKLNTPAANITPITTHPANVSSTTRVQKHRQNATDEQIKERQRKDREYKRRKRLQNDGDSDAGPTHPTLLPERRPVRDRTPSAVKKCQLEDSVRAKIANTTYNGLEMKITDDRGRGIFAEDRGQRTTIFSRGDFLLEYEGELISRDEGLQIDSCYRFFFSYNGTAYCVDATAEDGTYGRLINHSRRGNCVPKVIDIHGKPRLYFVAAADIIEGQELLFDYGERRADILEDEPFLKE